MSSIAKVGKITATFAVALGVGYFMQYGGGAASDPADNEKITNRSLVVVGNATGGIGFGVPDVVTTPLPHLSDFQTVGLVGDTYDDVTAPEMETLFGLPFGTCQPNMSADAIDAAMVRLTIVATCHKNEIFIIRHEGVRFTGIIDTTGDATVDVPALSQVASFTLSFNHIDSAEVSVNVPDLAVYDRAVLQWRGRQNIQLHALEFGASVGQLGHIWSASVNDMASTKAGQRGFMVRLGTLNAEIPYIAEIYTFPTGTTTRSGEIKLQIGATVTKNNCGRTIPAQSTQVRSGEIALQSNLQVPVPSCDAVGQSLMFNDMFQTLTLAASN